MAEAREKETTKTAVKPVAKAAATKAAAEVKEAAKEVKETVKEVPAKAAAATKTVAKKATAKKPAAAKKAPVKKAAAAKKTPAKKEALKAVVNLQFAGKSYTDDDLLKIAKDVWKYDLKQKASDFKSVELYVKPEENRAYYVINGEVTGSFAI